MTTPGGGGDRLDVEVVADATGFAKDAKAKVEAATKNLRAKIRADIDTARLQAQTEAAARRVEKTTRVQLKVGVDARYLQESIKGALSRLTGREFRVKVTADVDTAGAEAQLAGLGRVTPGRPAGGGGGGEETRRAADNEAVLATTQVRSRGAQDALNRSRESAVERVGRYRLAVQAQAIAEERAAIAVQRARQRLSTVEANPRSSPIDTRAAQLAVRVAEQGLQRVQNAGRGTNRVITDMMKSFGRVGLIAGGVQLLVSAVTALGAGLYAIIGAASQAVGTLAILPSLVGIAATAIGTLFAGFSGIGDAVSAMGKAQTGAGAAATNSARVQERAQQRIADARQRVADVAQSSARSIIAAEDGVVAAQKRRERAQKALNDAIAAATDRLADYKLELSGAALDEEAASLAVERARERWNETMRSPVSTTLDRKEVDLALRQAEQRLAEVQDSNKDLYSEADKAIQAGVEGAADVVSAREDVIDAAKAEKDAEQDLADARIQATRDAADAQRDLADAVADAAEAMASAAGGGGVDALAAAMDKLSPAGQRFARFVNDTLKPRLTELKKGIQEALLPGVQAGVTAALPLLDTLQTGLEGTGSILGDVARRAGELMGSDLFRADVATIMESNNRATSSFGDAGLSLINVFRDLAVAAGPLVERFALWIKDLAAGAEASAHAGRESGRLQAFFERAGDRAAQLGDIVKNLATTLYNLGVAGTGTGDSLLDKFEKLTERWSNWSESDAGQKRLREFFESMEPAFTALSETVSKLSEAFVKMGENGGGGLTGFLTVINGVLDAFIAIMDGPAGPLLGWFLTLAGAAGAISLIGGIFGGMARNIGGLVSGISGGVTATSNFVSGLRGSADAASGLAGRAGEVGSKLRSLATGLGGVAVDGAKAVGEAGKAAAAWVAAAGRAAAGWALATATTIAAWTSMVWHATVNAVKVAAAWIAQTAAAGLAVVGGWTLYAATTALAWVRMATAATVNAVKVAATWIAQTAAAGLAVVGGWALHAAATAVAWVGMAAAASLNALKIAATWLVQTALTTAGMIAGYAVAAASVVASWVVMGAQSLLQAARMAAAWVIAMGPIGWIIAAVVAFVALVIANWDTIKTKTKQAFDWIAEKVSGVWSGLGNGLKSALNFVIRMLNGGLRGINRLIGGVNNIPGVNIPTLPMIPELAEGAIVTKATLAWVGEDGPEAVIPLSDKRKKRREELMQQAGLRTDATRSAAASRLTPQDMASAGGWGPLSSYVDRPAPSLAATVAAPAGATTDSRPQQSVGTLIEEGAIHIEVVNPKPETTGETLNARLRRLGSQGIFDGKPGS